MLGTGGMVLTENMQPSTVRKFTKEFVGQADMPFDFFMSRELPTLIAAFRFKLATPHHTSLFFPSLRRLQGCLRRRDHRFHRGATRGQARAVLGP